MQAHTIDKMYSNDPYSNLSLVTAYAEGELPQKLEWLSGFLLVTENPRYYLDVLEDAYNCRIIYGYRMFGGYKFYYRFNDVPFHQTIHLLF